MAKGKQKTKMEKTMGEFKRGELHSGSKTGPKVKSRKQATSRLVVGTQTCLT